MAIMVVVCKMIKLISRVYNINNRDVLYEIAEEVIPDDDIEAMIQLMRYEMHNNKVPGIGLAAPQIGLQKRLILIHTVSFQKVILNPVITRTRLGKTISKEGCLSFPGKTVKMKRHKQIIVEGFDENWKPVKFKLRGLDSTVVQHEIDHLDGITIVKRNDH